MMRRTTAAAGATTVLVLALAACGPASRPAGEPQPVLASRAECAGRAAADGHGAPTVPDSLLGRDFRPTSGRRTPKYPDAAQHDLQPGMVVISFVVDTGGRVDWCSVRVRESFGRWHEREFVRSVLEWVETVTYPRPTRNGAPVRVLVDCHVVSFAIEGESPPPEPSTCTPWRR